MGGGGQMGSVSAVVGNIDLLQTLHGSDLSIGELLDRECRIISTLIGRALGGSKSSQFCQHSKNLCHLPRSEAIRFSISLILLSLFSQ